MSSSSSTSLLLLLLPLLLLLLTTSSSMATTPTPTTKTPPRSLLFPLKTQKLPPFPLPNKLRFHHNITLTVSLSVGTPPRNATLVLDTGSELSWLHCSPSLTSRPVPCSSPTCTSDSRDLPSPPSCLAGNCRVALSYADGSSSDVALTSDLLRLPSSPPLRAAFGCAAASSSAAPGDSPAAGILGMNRGALSFVSQTATRRFSYCISDRDAAGVLVIGDRAGDLADVPPLNYTPLVDVPPFPLPYFDRVAYSVQLQGIRVGPKVLPIPKSSLAPDHTGAGQTMVDSGTQFTFLMPDAYNALKMEFLAQTRGVLAPLDEPEFAFQGAMDQCFKVPAWRSRAPEGLPEVTVMLAGAEVRVGGERLLYRVSGERRGGDAVWCLTFGNSEMVPMEAYVIGHHHQMNVWVEYDLQNRRVGLAPVRCDLASQRLGLSL